jgi:hypothetical protein
MAIRVMTRIVKHAADFDALPDVLSTSLMILKVYVVRLCLGDGRG